MPFRAKDLMITLPNGGSIEIHMCEENDCTRRVSDIGCEDASCRINSPLCGNGGVISCKPTSCEIPSCWDTTCAANSCRVTRECGDDFSECRNNSCLGQVSHSLNCREAGDIEGAREFNQLKKELKNMLRDALKVVDLPERPPFRTGESE